MSSSREIGGGVPQACASCKHQRKRCDETCELAPYFPATKFQEFLNAYKLFGVSNIIKILNSVEPHRRHVAAESIVEEASIRKDDPVHGCLGIVQKLHSQIEIYQKELDLVNQQLTLLRKKELLQNLWTNKTSLPLVTADQFGSSYSSPTLSSSENPIDVPYCQAPVLSDLPSETFYLDATSEGYNYLSTLEESGGVKPYDIESIDQMMDAHPNGNGFTNFKETHGLSVASRGCGKQTGEFDHGGKMKGEVGSPTEAKDIKMKRRG